MHKYEFLKPTLDDFHRARVEKCRSVCSWSLIEQFRVDYSKRFTDDIFTVSFYE